MLMANTCPVQDTLRRAFSFALIPFPVDDVRQPGVPRRRPFEPLHEPMTPVARPMTFFAAPEDLSQDDIGQDDPGTLLNDDGLMNRPVKAATDSLPTSFHLPHVVGGAKPGSGDKPIGLDVIGHGEQKRDREDRATYAVGDDRVSVILCCTIPWCRPEMGVIILFVMPLARRT